MGCWFFWGVSFFSSLYILVINPLSDVELAKIFSHSVGYLFSLVSFFCYEEAFNFDAVPFIHISLSCWTIGVLPIMLLTMPICSSVYTHSFLQQFHNFRSYIKIIYLLWIDTSTSYKLRDWNPLSIFHRWISSFFSTIYWRGCLSSNA
jgi:hypothetical protein